MERWHPELGVNFEVETDPEGAAWWIDFMAQTASVAAPALWGRPAARDADKARRTVWAIGSGVVDAPVKKGSLLEIMRGRTNSASEELAMLCGGLETLFPERLRTWNIHTQAVAPSKVAAFPKFVERIKRANPEISEQDAQKRAEYLVQASRIRLLWSLATVIAARDIVQHGNGFTYSLSHTGVWTHVTALQGLGYLPKGPIVAISPHLDLKSHTHFVKLCNNLQSALEKVGSELNKDEVKGLLASFVCNPPSLTEAIATIRLTLALILIDSTPELGPVLRKAILAQLGWPDGLYWEDELE